NLPTHHIKNLPPHGLRYFRNDGVSKLAVSLSVRYDNRLFIKPHKPCTLFRRQSARRATSLWNQNLGAVFVIPSAKRARYSLRVSETKPKTIPLEAMPLSVILQVFPKMIGKRVLRVRLLFKNVSESWPHI